MWPPGDGEMCRRIAAYDWAATPLGPIATWPQPLKTAVEMMLASAFPAALHVGKERIHLYNDASARAIGDWHPGALGRSSHKAFPGLVEIHERVWRGETVTSSGFMFSVPSGGEPKHAWYSRMYSPVRDEHGRVFAAFVIGQDDTERHRATEALAESEERLHTALIAGRMAAWSWTPATDTMTASTTMADLCGLPVGETLRTGEQMHALVHPEDAGEHRAAVAAAVREGRGWQRMFRIVRARDGQTRWLDERATARLTRDGVLDITAIVADVTERKQAEAAIAVIAHADAYRVRLSDALRTLTDPRDIQDTAARTLGEHLGTVRVHFAQIEGDVMVYEREYAPGMPSMLGRHPVPSGGQFHVDAYRAGRLVVCDDVTTQVSADQLRQFERIAVRAFVGVPVMRDGKWVAILTAHSPVVRAWRPDEVQLIVETAERTWNALDRELTAAALRDSDRRKDEFIALLAHELRNPLAPLRTGLEVIRLAPHDPVLIAETRELMQRQLEHMVRLVDDLLDASRITSGKITLRRRPSALGELLRTALEANLPAMAEKHLGLDAQLDTPAVVDVDTARIVQVMSNIFHNACKFTPPDGRIAITTELAGSCAVVRVRDTGAGIARELLPHVFDLFTQGTRGPEVGGLGIGLALAKQLVEMHGGSIEAHSAGVGEGTEIVVRLPVVSVAVAPEPTRGEPAKVVRNVVIIDDNRDGARSLAMLIKALGGIAHIAHDGASGVALVREVRPQVVLLDIGLPDVDGYEACRQIRAELGKAARIIAVTGWGLADDKRRAAEAGFDAHVTKPPDPSTLRRYLSMWG